mmetsp:Transcript_7707/g.23327  ORF Transcript_7707/g.23327 Transcript_7707/m.23327 type:complete len:324 (+) Transcript_7707:83-1054(+)
MPLLRRAALYARRASGSTSAAEKASVVIECPDKLGLVANVAQLVARRGGNITTIDQYLAPAQEPELRRPEATFRDWWRDQHPEWYKNNFLLRVEFSFQSQSWQRVGVREDLENLAAEFGGSSSVRFHEEPLTAAILASKSDHCTAELLYRWKSGELRCRISKVISNHETLRSLAESYKLPFYHLPVRADEKFETEILDHVTHSSDFLVLARYMQILSPQFLNAYRRPIINIHHGLLPAFKGSRPYEQMYRAGVKIIGATAHYVTPELDEGPIIHQEVAPVNHRLSTSELKQVGIGLERSSLVSAVKKHVDNKLVRFGDRVIVF